MYGTIYSMSFDELLQAEEHTEEQLAETTDPDQRRRLHTTLRKIKARISKASTDENFNRWGRK